MNKITSFALHPVTLKALGEVASERNMSKSAVVDELLRRGCLALRGRPEMLDFTVELKPIRNF